MAATEDISLRIALDDRQAQAGLDGLRQQTAGLAATAEGAAGGIGSITSKVDKFKGTIEPTATAVNGMASAFGGLSTQTGAVLGGVSNLASAFMAGGPLALGLVTIGTAVSALTTAYQENKKAAEEAAKKQQEAINKIIEAGLGPLEAATLRLNQAKKELELQNMLTGKDSDQLVSNLRPVVMEIESLEMQIQAAQRELKRLKLEAVEGIRKGESIEQMKARRQEAEKEVEATQAQISLLQQARTIRIEETKVVDKSTRVLMDRNKALKEEEEARRDAEKAQKDADKAAEQSLKFNEGLRIRYAKLIQKRKQEREKEIQDQMAETARVGPTREMFDQEQVRLQSMREKEKEALKKAEDEKTKEMAKAAEERKKIQQQELKDNINEYKNLIGSVIGASQNLVDEIITGQEKAFDRFMVAIMRQAGTFMLGKGLELGALATFNALSGNPVLMAAAGGQFAGAAALVGGGIALGAAATGIEHVAIGGGQLFQALPEAEKEKTTSTPMGAGRISTGGTGERGGGGMEQVTYVFNAPVFGDQNRSARHVAALQRHAQRNLLLA